jgi:hypothetical protein
MTMTYETVSVHILPIEDRDGQLIDAHTLCSDYCHREYAEKIGVEYGGWYGCQEVDAPAWCANCNEKI